MKANFIKKERYIILISMLVLGIMACSRNENPPISILDSVEEKEDTLEEIDLKRKELESLREFPSVTRATIQTNDTIPYEFKIDFEKAKASIIVPNQEIEIYLLGETQMDSLKCLLSEYALIVYDGNPYWPTGNYCTMIQLFDYSIDYSKGYYREYGATHYPEGWDDFIEKLRELIISDNKITENTEKAIEEGIKLKE